MYEVVIVFCVSAQIMAAIAQIQSMSSVQLPSLVVFAALRHTPHEVWLKPCEFCWWRVGFFKCLSDLNMPVLTHGTKSAFMQVKSELIRNENPFWVDELSVNS